MALLHSILRRAGIFLAMLAAMLVVGDEFPFSNFPMYGKLPDAVFSMRLVDERGELLASTPDFNVGTTILKKHMEREFHAMKAAGKVKLIANPPPAMAREVGQKVLDWMLQHYPPLKSELGGALVKLEMRRYVVKKRDIVIESQIVGEGRAQPFKPKP